MSIIYVTTIHFSELFFLSQSLLYYLNLLIKLIKFIKLYYLN